MLSRRSELMIIGTLMALETCLILGQVSHNLLYSMKSSWRIYLVRGRLTRKQLTSRPDHLWPELWKSMGKHAKLKGKDKVVWGKDSSWKRKKIVWDLFHRPWGYGIQGNHQECGRSWKHQSLLLCPVKLEQLWEWWIQQNSDKSCVYSGSLWIHKNAYAKFDTA